MDAEMYRKFADRLNHLEKYGNRHELKYEVPAIEWVIDMVNRYDDAIEEIGRLEDELREHERYIEDNPSTLRRDRLSEYYADQL